MTQPVGRPGNSNLYKVSPSHTYVSSDAKLLENTENLPITNISKYSAENMAVLQKVLFKWLSAMPPYKSSTFESLFKKPGTKDIFTFNAIKALSICYGIKFDGDITAHHKKLFESIAKGQIGNTDLIYKLKSGRGEYLYGLMLRSGVSEALEKISEKKNIKKIYAQGETSDGVAIIQTYLDKWLSKMNHKDNKLEVTGAFNGDTALALKMFNKRFGIKASVNEITDKHLEIFRDIEYGTLTAEKYKPSGNKEQVKVYRLLCKYCYKDAEAVLRKEFTRRQLASRSGSLFKGSIPSNWGTLTAANITSRLDIKWEIAEIALKLKDYLSNYGYQIHITSGRRTDDSSSRHYSGNAVDFVVYKNGKEITAKESKIVEGLVNQFKKEYGIRFTYYNEYIVKFKSTNGDNMHINT